MIITKAYDVEVLPNFFSLCIVDVGSYLKIFKDCVNSKGQPIPLVQKYTSLEIKAMLDNVERKEFYITDTDDSQLFEMIGYIKGMEAYRNDKGVVIRHDMYGYNSSRYDVLMVSALLMNFEKIHNTAELITELHFTSKRIIEIQNDKEASRKDYFLSVLRNYGIPYKDADIMRIFALNKCGKGVDKNGETVYFPKGLKQTSINLQWHELLEFELPPISDFDAHLYEKDPSLVGISGSALNNFVDKWDRYIHNDWIPKMMKYNVNDVLIVCEMIRLYIDEIRMRYNISKSYKVDVISSSRSDISDVLLNKFYSDFSGLHPRQWQGKRTERTAMAFKRVILPVVEFKTDQLKAVLADMKKVVVRSIGKTAFVRNISFGGIEYTIATGGLHTKDIPKELKSKCWEINPETGERFASKPKDKQWSNLTDDSYVYRLWDIVSYYPAIIVAFGIAPEHLDKKSFVKLVEWVMNTRIQAKHSLEDYIDGVPKKVLSDALKIVVNAIYGKLGYEYGHLLDKLAVLGVTINGQLLIIMLCEDLFLSNIEVVSANTDGILVKLYKKDLETFERIADEWMTKTGLKADVEDYENYVNRDVNNYVVRDFKGKLSHKGALNPKMYAVDLSKGYDMPVVAEAVVNYFLDGKPVLETLYENNNILDFCKTQNVGKQFHIELTKGSETKELQRQMRFYVSTHGGIVEKVNNHNKTRGRLAAGSLVTILNSLDDMNISLRSIDYSYYYEECMKIINPIKLGISPSRKSNKDTGSKSGKALLKQYAGMYKTLFDDDEEDFQ